MQKLLLCDVHKVKDVTVVSVLLKSYYILCYTFQIFFEGLTCRNWNFKFELLYLPDIMHTVFFKIDIILISCTFSSVRCLTRSCHWKCYLLKCAVIFSGNIWRESNMHYENICTKLWYLYCLTYVPGFFMLTCDHFCAIQMFSWSSRNPVRMN